MSTYKILIAEEEPIVARDIEHTLRCLGFDPVGMVHTGEEAVAKVKELQPDIILMDITLPGSVNGIQATGYLNENFDLPVLYLTPFVDRERLAKAGFGNVYGYILKPFQETEMSAEIETAIRQHQNQKKYKDQENMLSAILDNLPDSIIALGNDTEVMYMNASARQLLDVASSVFLGKELSGICEFTDAQSGLPVDFRDARVLKEILLKTDRSYIPAEILSSPYSSGTIDGHIITLRPFKNKQKPDLSAVFHNPHISIILLKKDYTIESFNEKAFAIIAQAAGIELAVHENFLNYNFKALKEILDAVLKGETKSYTFPVGESAENSWFEFNFYRTTSHVGEVTGICVMGCDITDRKRSQQALEESEGRYRMFVEQISEGIWRLDIDEPISIELPEEEQVDYCLERCYIADCNDIMARIYGFNSSEEMIGVFLKDVLVKGEENREVLKNFIRNGYRSINSSSYETDKNGNNLYFRNNSFGVVANGHLVSIWGTQQNITPQKNIEEALRKSEEKYRAVVDNLNEGIVITDENDNIIFINHRMSELSQYDAKDLVNQTVDNMILRREGLEDLLRQRMQQRLSGIPGKYSEQLRRKDGSVIWVEISAAPFFDTTGKIIGSIGVFSDITDRIQAEEALRVSEEKYRQLIGNAPVGITRLLLKENRYEVVNTTFLTQTGLSLEEFDASSRKQRAAMIHPDDYDTVAEFSAQWNKEDFKGFRHITYRIINKSNELVWLDTYSYADFDENGKPFAINQISIDVTDLKNAEAALAETLQKDFRNTVQNLQIIVFKFYRREDGNYAYSMREGKLAGDLTTEKVRGKNPHEVFDYYSTDTDALVEQAFAGQSVKSEQFYEGRWRMLIYEPIFKDGIVTEVVGSSIDISERRQAEQQLRDSEQRYKMLLEYLPVGILQEETSETGDKISEYVNPAFVKHSGYTLEEFTALKKGEISERIHPNDRAYALDIYKQWRLKSDDAVLHVTYRFKDKVGQYRWLDNYVIKFPSARGHIYLQAALDVTEQKKNEANLRTTTSRLSTLIANLQGGILVEDASRNVVLVNQNFCAIFGLDIQADQLLHTDGLRAIEELKKHFKEPVLFAQRVENIIAAKVVIADEEITMSDGRILERDYIPIFVDNIYQGHLWQYRDITARKNTERELRRALEKERELGILRTRFVSTISHEFRTPLTGVMMSAELIEAYSENMSKEQRIVEIQKIKSRVDELVALLNDFLLQSSATTLRERFSPLPVSIDEICRKAAYEIQETLVGKKQRLHLDIANNIPQILGDKRILHYVFNNLLSNASKYSNPGTSIYFTVQSNAEIILISIKDEGMGIPAEEIGNLFIPYYRASNVRDISGTGLGLSTVKEFIDMHQGSISIESELGSYTLCTVTIPIVQAL